MGPFVAEIVELVASDVDGEVPLVFEQAAIVSRATRRVNPAKSRHEEVNSRGVFKDYDCTRHELIIDVAPTNSARLRGSGRIRP
jgi:hypothetical protein